MRHRGYSTGTMIIVGMERQNHTVSIPVNGSLLFVEQAIRRKNTMGSVFLFDKMEIRCVNTFVIEQPARRNGHRESSASKILVKIRVCCKNEREIPVARKPAHSLRPLATKD